MKKHLSFVALILSLSLLAGCGAKATTPGNDASVPETAADAGQEEAPSNDDGGAEEDAPEDAGFRTITGLNGTEIEVPETVDTIISLAPSTTELLIDLGLSDKIVATDTYSAVDYADDLSSGIPAFDMMNPDNEQIVALNADIVFTTGMSYAWGDDVFASAREAGVIIIDIESPATLQEIADSIRFIGDCAGASDEAFLIADDMEGFLTEVSSVMDAADITTRRSVLFELSTPSADYPVIYSAGPGSYIDEIISLTGGENIASGVDSPWPALDEEFCVSANPDVILTTDNYTPDVENVLLGLDGWGAVNAIQNRDVYLIDANRINRPNQHVCGAILEIGTILYPELFEDFVDPFEEEALLNAA